MESHGEVMEWFIICAMYQAL